MNDGRVDETDDSKHDGIVAVCHLQCNVRVAVFVRESMPAWETCEHNPACISQFLSVLQCQSQPPLRPSWRLSLAVLHTRFNGHAIMPHMHITCTVHLQPSSVVDIHCTE